MFRSISAQQAQELVAKGELEVIDVRDVHEWSTGHIAGARLLPLAQLRAAAKTLPRSGVLFVCAAGVRSETAARQAAQLGLERVYSLAGGTRAWARSGLPLVKDLDVAV